MNKDVNYYLCIKYLYPEIKDNQFKLEHKPPNNELILSEWNYPSEKPTLEKLAESWDKADVYFRLDAIRNERNKRLAMSDWTHLTDHPLSEEKQLQWREYRKLLRNFLEVVDPYNPIWPPAPKSDISKEKKGKIKNNG